MVTNTVRDRWRRGLLAFQAGYYVLTGLWPLVHLSSFEAVTGPKIDDWLVRMVGLLAAAIGATLGVAAARQHTRTPEAVVLAASAALAFAAIDLWYGLNGRISLIYLADAAVQLGLIALLALTGTRKVKRGSA
jgi:energy-converting hydrogenase Eha subunit E